MKSIHWIVLLLLPATLPAQSADSIRIKPGDRLHDRPHAVMGELAWNGLGGGLGIFYSHYLPEQAHVADLAFGIGLTGARLGARYRHLLVPKRRTSPFVGLGLNYATGMGVTEIEVTNSLDDTLKVRVRESANLLLNLGLDLKANNGFVFIPSVGWGFDLMDDDYEVVSGVETNTHRQVLRLMVRSGFQISFITGWSF